MKDMNENIEDFESNQSSSGNDETFSRSASQSSSSKGDYIDFEEIK
jgi:hypothetical protein